MIELSVYTDTKIYDAIPLSQTGPSRFRYGGRF